MTVWLDDTTDEVVYPPRDPETGEVTGDPPNATPVPVSIRNGVLICMIRAATFNQIRAEALATGVLVKHLDDEGNPVKDAEGNDVLVRGPGVCGFTYLGYPVDTPGTYDEEGNELTPPTYQDLYCCNFWLDQKATARGLWKDPARLWAAGSSVVAVRRAEKGKKFKGVELLDPDSVSTPINRAQ